jgi:hypothetical protein
MGLYVSEGRLCHFIHLFIYLLLATQDDPDGPPPIYITSPDMIHGQQQQDAQNIMLSMQDNLASGPRQNPPQLSVKTENLSQPGTPLSCHSSNHFLSDDEVMPLHSPLTPNSFLNLDQYPQ